jgi:predicted DNA binding CopG/RHH family protein
VNVKLGAKVQEKPVKLNMFLAELQRTASFDSAGSVHAVTVRIPTTDFSQIEGFVSYSGMARNKVIVHLLQVGIEQVLKGLGPDIKKPLFEQTVDALRSLYTDEEGNFSKTQESSSNGEI